MSKEMKYEMIFGDQLITHISKFLEFDILLVVYGEEDVKQFIKKPEVKHG